MLDALVSRKQIGLCFNQMPQKVCAARKMPDKIRERVPGHRASNRERPTAISVELEMLYSK